MIRAGGGRSAATRARALDAGLRDTGSLGPLCATAAVVVSVCPPDAAFTVATAVAAELFKGTDVDANAIAPSTARRIDELVRGGGASYVAGDLRCEGERSLPEVADRFGSSAGAARKAWRWRGEMHEIARTMDEAGLPGEFHEGAAEVFRRLASLDDAPGVTIDDVLRQLLDG